MTALQQVNQAPALPHSPRPIILIGAGGIVRDAHLPAYRKAGFGVAGIYDLDASKAQALARDFGIPRVYASLAEAVIAAPQDSIFDIAVPASAIYGILRELPRGSYALIQKPLGETLDQARVLVAQHNLGIANQLCGGLFVVGDVVLGIWRGSL